MTTSTITTSTKIVTHTTIESDDFEDMSVTLKIDDDGFGTFVIDDDFDEEFLELGVQNLDALIDMLIRAQAIVQRLNPRAD